jgi:hypothetical protein
MVVPGWGMMQGSSVLRTLWALWRRETALTGCAALAFALAGVCLLVAAARGSWSVPPEGRLLEAAKFEVGVGIYFLTLALLVPLSGMTARARRRWIRASAVVAVYFVLVETVQAVRGFDPRFTAAGTPLDQAAGAMFGVSALLLTILFMILARRFYRHDVLAEHPPLRSAIRYGIAATLFAFGAGIVMTMLRTRLVAGTGSLMPVHAAGFHGLQALPLVALLAGRSTSGGTRPVPLTHLAGLAWLVLCASLLLQALEGAPLLSMRASTVAAAIALLVWLSCVVVGARAWRRRRDAFRSRGDP